MNLINWIFVSEQITKQKYLSKSYLKKHTSKYFRTYRTSLINHSLLNVLYIFTLLLSSNPIHPSFNKIYQNTWSLVKKNMSDWLLTIYCHHLKKKSYQTYLCLRLGTQFFSHLNKSKIISTHISKSLMNVT